MKATTFTISLPEDLASKVEKIAKEESRTRSELFREALRRFVDARDFEKMRQQASLEAIKLGLNNERDVDDLIHSIRKHSDQS